MNNVAQRWLRLSGLCPLLAITLTPTNAALLGAALLTTLLFTDLCMALLQRWLVESQRLTITALIAALAAAVIDLLLQALCYQHAQHLQTYLPLLIIAPLLLYKTDTASNWPRVLLDALLGGSAFMFALIGIAALRALVPADAGLALGFIGSMLLLVLANKIGSPPSDTDIANPQPPTSRTRARVTGPVR